MAWIAAVIAGLAGLALGYVARLVMARRGLEDAGRQADGLVAKAKAEAEATLKEAQLTVKADVIKAREEFEQSTRARRQELSVIEERIAQKELNLERKEAVVDKKEKALEDRVKALEDQSAELTAQRKDADRLAQQARDELQRVAAMTRDDARKAIMARVETEVHAEMGTLIRRMQEKAKDQALVPRGHGGVNDLSVLLVASQVPKLHKQQAAGIAKRRMARPRRIHDVSACGVVARFVAKNTLQNQDLFAHIVVMLRKARASIVANDRGGTRHLITKPLEESSLNTGFWAVDPGKVIVV